MNLKIVAIVQARMSSSRLPGKVLLDIAGQTMLLRTIERLRRAALVNQVWVATTTHPSDDILAAYCSEHQLPFHRGSLHDVLDRFYQTAQASQADVIVRITADCPLIDPQVVDDVVRIFLGQQVCPWSQISQGAVQPKARFPYDFAANRLPPPWKRTFPIGLDVEVCSAEALERAWKEASQPYQREHVMPYLYDDVGVDFNQPSRFRVILVNHDVDYGTFRWTVDTAQDFELINLIFQRLGGKGDFSWLDVLALFEREPELAAINSQVAHKTLYEVDHRA